MFNDRILAKAEEIKNRLNHNRLRSDLIPEELIHELCDVLWAERIKPKTEHLQELLDANTYALRRALPQWRKKKGFPETGMRSDKVLPANLDELRTYISPELHIAPLTCLDPNNDGRWSEPSVKNMAYLGRIDNQSVRDLCCLFLLMQTDNKQFPVYNHITNFSRSIQAVMTEQNIENITDIDPNVLLYQVFEGKAGQALTDHTRQHLISFWNRTHNQIDDYLEQLNDAQKQIFKRFQISPITDRRKMAKFRHWKTVNEAQQDRVKAKTDIVHGQFHKIRFMAKVRVNQTKRLFDAFKEAVDYVEMHNSPFPHKFSYVEETYTQGGQLIKQRISLALWDRKSLVKQSEKYNKRNWKRDWFIQARIDGLSEMSDDPSPESSVIHSNYVVEFIGIDPIYEKGATEPFWFLEMYRYRLFSMAYHPEVLELQKQFNERWGYDEHNGWLTKIGFYSFPPHLSRLAQLLQRKESRIFLPVEGLYAASLLGYLCVRVQTITGARIGEVMQIAQNPECIIQIDNIGPKQETKWVLRLVPKGRKERANYFIDVETKDLLMEIVSYLREKHKASKIPIVDIYLNKTPPDRYLLQWRGKGIDVSTLSIMIRVLLHGVVLKDDGKVVHITSHLLRHAFATEMASLKVNHDIIAEVLHQHDTSVTKYYAKPTPTQIATAAEVLFVDRINVATDVFRNPQEIKEMLDNAQDKIGALTEVIGGTCVVSNMCPVKFACIGCAGNAPDPKKRYQIERKSEWAMKQAKWARDENLLVEERQLENVQKNCHVVLEEMNLIEKAEQDAKQAVALLHETNGDSEKQ